MRAADPLLASWFVGIFGLGLSGCGDSGGGVPSSGGTTGVQTGGTGGNGNVGSGGRATNPPASGGTGQSGTGGTGASGGTGALGGTGASGGSSGQAAVGGMSGSGGAGPSSGAGGTATVAGQSNAGGGRRNGAGGAAQASAGRAGDAGSAGSSMTGAGGGSGGRAASGGAGAGASGGNPGSGTCTASKASSTKVSGSGTHQVTVETNSGAGISEGTIFRPTDLGGTEKYPIIVWGEGGCSENGLSNSAAMAELASHGYFVIADGTPNGSASRTMDSSNPASMGKPLLAYVDWAVAENGKSCSAYYQSLDATKIGANGFSCGGLMSEGTAGDPRITTWGLNSSGLLSENQAFYKTVHTPVLVVLGGSGDVAYANGERDYTNLAGMAIPIMLFSKALGHGGDLFSKNGGDFTKIDLGWFNWWLKGDETANGKGVLVGASCTYCTDSAWEVKSANLP